MSQGLHAVYISCWLIAVRSSVVPDHSISPFTFSGELLRASLRFDHGRDVRRFQWQVRDHEQSFSILAEDPCLRPRVVMSSRTDGFARSLFVYIYIGSLSNSRPPFSLHATQKRTNSSPPSVLELRRSCTHHSNGLRGERFSSKASKSSRDSPSRVSRYKAATKIQR